MPHECDDCGDTFGTLTRKRLHDCPGSGNIVDDALLPEPDPENLPQRPLTTEEFEQIQGHDVVDRVDNLLDFPLPGDHEAIAFTMQMNDYTWALHSDNDTGTWTIIADGPDYDVVSGDALDWIGQDIGRVTGGAADPDSIKDMDIPETIEIDCPYCDGAHILETEADELTAIARMFEYEGSCEETGEPIIEIRSFDELLA